MVLNG